MHKRSVSIGFIWLPIAALLFFVVGCAQRPESGTMLETFGEDTLILDMPALAITFDAAGNPNLGDVPLAELVGPDAADALSAIQLDAGTLDLLRENNIQHIQISNQTNGLRILVNGKAMPSIAWDGETIDDTVALVDSFGASFPVLQDLLPFIRHLGVGVVIRFPMDEGTALLPPTAGDDAAAQVQQAQEAFLAGVGSPPTILLNVYYQPDGSWTVSGLTDTEYSAILPQVPWQDLRLLPDSLQDMVDAGMSEITVTSNAEGISLSINDMTLPHISWGDGELVNALELAAEAGLLETLADSGLNVDDVAGLVSGIAPIVQAADVRVVAHLPSSEEIAAAQE